jgi:hypothetical protein
MSPRKSRKTLRIRRKSRKVHRKKTKISRKRISHRERFGGVGDVFRNAIQIAPYVTPGLIEYYKSRSS